MKNILHTYTFCGKIQGCKEFLINFTNCCRPLQDPTRNGKTNFQTKMRLKRKEREKKRRRKIFKKEEGINLKCKRV